MNRLTARLAKLERSRVVTDTPFPLTNEERAQRLEALLARAGPNDGVLAQLLELLDTAQARLDAAEAEATSRAGEEWGV